MNIKLAKTARVEASKFFHGNIMGVKSNLQPIANLFPISSTWNLDSWENCWCAAFIYYVIIKAGYELPVKYPDEKVTCNFAGCIAWEQWAKLEYNKFWFEPNTEAEVGDIVLFDNIFLNQEHDHIAIIVDFENDFIVTAEGNFNNVSAIVKRDKKANIRGFIRFEGFG
ncbi:MAG: CHAP domain-containing protein [Spirochaetales bacterium]|jgi:hypothetical protein|nr:CHAP domain-containing protein [Exilispira sp.]NMC67297.1 CHAP domain-containing protein [Spirochaetales bacterium]